MFWEKRYGVGSIRFGKRLHAFCSPFFPSFLRASLLLSTVGYVDRELRKRYAFGLAGLPVADTLAMEGAVLIQRDVSPILMTLLRQHRKAGDHATIDSLLAAAYRTLGEAHAAGLCHGRPHPRDMFVQEGRIGFIDFEEEPETQMKLADAQARDAWLFMFQVARFASSREAAKAALDAYLAAAPANAFLALRKLVRFFRPFIAVGVVLSLFHRGADLDRFLGAMGVLSEHTFLLT